MRLFAAIVPPDDVLRHLDAAVQPVRDDALRWTGVDAWHLTLAFYGEVPDGRVDELSERLGRAAGRHPPVQLALAGAGRFGERVLWVSCDGDLPVLRKIAESCTAAGRRVGVDEGRRFRAHLTLARASSRPVDTRPYVVALAAYAGPAWTAAAITLVRSHLRAGVGGRSRYEQLGTFKLAG